MPAYVLLAALAVIAVVGRRRRPCSGVEGAGRTYPSKQPEKKAAAV
ncbi:hypothetical protein ACIPSA_45095 [Streptomyces sp. NPDC086549]